MDGNQRVVEFITRTRWDDLPPEVQQVARMALLDVLGATLAGTLTRVGRITAQFGTETWPGDESTILLAGRKASAIGAAFANGYAANGVDIDDCGLYTKGHPGVLIFPTALALAEAQILGGAQMLAAMVIGYEVAHRAARIWHAAHEVYQACGSWGSVACAAVASALMGLPPEQVWHALGIAEYHAPNLPMLRDIDHPAMVKHGIGWGAITGISAARLAALGFTGIPGLFGFEAYADWVADIGERYIMAGGVVWKRYACCAWTHAALHGTQVLMQQYGFRAGDVAHIRVEAYDDAARLGVRLPTTTEEAQFNMAWPLAALLVDGEVGPDQVLEERLADPRIRDLAGRVEVVETPEMNELYRKALAGEPGGRFANVVTITLRDGRALSSGVVEAPEIKYPQSCWDMPALEEKFRRVTGQVLDAPRVEALVKIVRHFEDVPDVRTLTALLG
jgi:2-methylcitrate dehydratase PrpD